MNVYTLDAAAAFTIIFVTVLTAAAMYSLKARTLSAPESELAELLDEPAFVKAVYSGDSKTVEAYLNSFLSQPYNFTAWDGNGRKVLSVGASVQGVAASAVLPGWNGSRETVTVSLRVGG